MQKAFPKDSTSTWHNQDSNPGPSDPAAKCLPLDHNTRIKYKNIRNSISILPAIVHNQDLDVQFVRGRD